MRKLIHRFLWALPLLLFFCVPGAFAQCPSQTPNVQFQIPNIGNTTTWGLCLNGDLSTLDNLLGGTAVFPVGTATAPISQHTNWVTANTGSQTVTNITGGFPGQIINIFCGVSDTFTQITSSATISISSTWSCATQKSITLTYIGTVWTETGRQAVTAVPWNAITNPTGNLTLSMGANATTFNQTSGAAWTWANTNAATNIADAPSPVLTLAGHFWNTVPAPASYAGTFTIQEAGGFLKFSQIVGGSQQVYPYQFDGNVNFAGAIQSGSAVFSFQTANAGEVITATSAANAIGNVTTYAVTIGAGGQPVAGQFVTIAGFVTHTSNNGRFVVQGATLTTLSVYSSAGIAETHAATATVDNQYSNLGGFSYSVNSSIITTFAIAGTSYPAVGAYNVNPGAPAFISNVKGDNIDASYWRIVNDGNTGNHFLEIGAITDGTGANPTYFRMGSYNGVTGPSFDAIGMNTNASTTIQHKVSVILLSTADLLGMPGTPKTLLPASGAGYYYRVTSYDFSYVFNTTAFTLGNSDNVLDVQYTGGADTGVEAGALGLVDQTVSKISSTGWGNAGSPVTTSAAVNKGLVLTLFGTTPGLTLGDGSLKVTIGYDIVPQ